MAAAVEALVGAVFKGSDLGSVQPWMTLASSPTLYSLRQTAALLTITQEQHSNYDRLVSLPPILLYNGIREATGKR